MLRSVIAPCLLAVCVTTALVACSGKDGAGGTDAQTVADADSPLPKPEPTSGSVTGMPDKPGPGTVGAPAKPDPDTALATDEAGNGIEAVAGAGGPVPVGAAFSGASSG